MVVKALIDNPKNKNCENCTRAERTKYCAMKLSHIRWYIYSPPLCKWWNYVEGRKPGLGSPPFHEHFDVPFENQNKCQVEVPF
jgi:hypothetical protein